MRNFFITMAIIGVMILAINWILKDYIYYRRVVKDQDLASTERYLDEFPGGFFADKVQAQHDEYSFQQAKKDDSKESYDRYIDEFGRGGKYISEAKAQSETLHFEGLKERQDIEEIMRFLERFPIADTKRSLKN